MKPLEYTYLEPAAIIQEQSQVFSKDYQDFYFNTNNGLEESNYVFISGNDLITQWSRQQQQAFFCIAETGFGSGLNFLNTCLAWQNCQQKPRHLHFISTELHPLTKETLKQIHQQFPQLSQYSKKLIHQYGSMRAGLHRYQIDDDITLTLLLGDVVESLKQLKAEVDAWYLDGFAPSRNPHMWRTELFKQMASLSKQRATFATFSSAATVKKGLAAAGFAVNKKPGFGLKREMLVGHFKDLPITPPIKQPWYPLPRKTDTESKVTILGGGIAGMCLAKSFHRIGYHTTVIDQHTQPLQQASGNGYAMVMPLITAQKSPEALFFLRAFEYAQQVYDSSIYHAVGVAEYAQTESERKRTKAIERLNLSDQVIISKHDQIKYPTAGYVDAHALVAQWQPFIDQWLQSQITMINKKDNRWQLFNHQGQLIHQCQTLIIASGMASQQLIHAQNLSLTAKLGQTHQLKTATPLHLKELQLNQGYLIPIDESAGHYLMGATFDHIDEQDCLKADFIGINHKFRNLEHWQNCDFYPVLSEAELLSSHTAIRATTPDHLPICGPIIDEQQFKLDYQDLHHGRHWQTYPEATVIENLYVLTGLGSRGFSSAPLLADHLMSMITGQPLPLEDDLCKIIHPNRFNYRRLKKPTKS